MEAQIKPAAGEAKEEKKTENHIEKVQKRDGKIVNFEQEKIAEAIERAVFPGLQGD